MDGKDRQIELPPRKELVAVLLVASTAITAGGVIFAVQSIQPGTRNLFNALVAGLIALLFSLGGASSAVTLVSKRPALRVNAVGIEDNTTLMGAGLIMWEEIAAISYFHFVVQGYILIRPRHVSAFARRKNPLQRTVLWVNSKISPAAICIPQAFLDVSSRDFLRDIRTRYAPEIERFGIYVGGERDRGGPHKRIRQ